MAPEWSLLFHKLAVYFIAHHHLTEQCRCHQNKATNRWKRNPEPTQGGPLLIEGKIADANATGQIIIEIVSVVFCTSAWALPAPQPDSSSITVTPAHAVTHKKRKYGPRSVPLSVTASTGQQTSATEAVVRPLRVFVSSHAFTRCLT